jgi:hypothetical protein
MKTKKGISAIVATVLIILISIVGVGIIWKGILPIFEDSSIQSSENAISIDTAGGYTLYDDTQKIACVQVRRESSKDIKGLRVVFSVEGNSYSGQISEGDVPGLNQKKTYCFSLKNFGKPTTVTVVPLPETSGGAVSSGILVSALTAEALTSIVGDSDSEGGSASQLRQMDGVNKYYYDSDGDGYGNSSNSSYFMASNVSLNYSLLWGDCNDLNVQFSPNVSEIRNNGIDENCDGFDNLNACAVLSIAGASYKLDNDISNSFTSYNSVCFSVTGANILFDGGNHSISGTGRGYEIKVTGVNDTIRNFRSIQNSGGDIWFSGSVNSSLLDMHFGYAQIQNSPRTLMSGGVYSGVMIEGSSSSSVIRNSQFINYGMVTLDASGIVMENNTLHSYVMTGFSGSNCIIRNNLIIGDDSSPGMCSLSSYGMVLLQGGNNILFEGNTVRDAGRCGAGLEVFDANNIIIRNNLIISNRGLGVSLDIDTGYFLLEGNNITENGEGGLTAQIYGAGSIVIQNNSVCNNLPYGDVAFSSTGNLSGSGNHFGVLRTAPSLIWPVNGTHYTSC